jgi:hypothetical protein
MGGDQILASPVITSSSSSFGGLSCWCSSVAPGRMLVMLFIKLSRWRMGASGRSGEAFFQ